MPPGQKPNSLRRRVAGLASEVPCPPQGQSRRRLEVKGLEDGEPRQVWVTSLQAEETREASAGARGRV